MGEQFRLDELAREAGLASTTVRLYQSKGLLAPPRLEGRTGWYQQTHLRRLRLVARLQEQGHSLAGIRRLLDRWEEGRSLDAVLGVEAELEALLGESHAITLSPEGLARRFPPDALTPDLFRRTVDLGLIELTDEGTVRVRDRRFLETGAELAVLGVPLDTILDEWERLVGQTDEIAARFLDLFERHIAPSDWERDLDDERTEELARVLAQLHDLARRVLVTALDTSVARAGRARLAQLLPEAEGAGD